MHIVLTVTVCSRGLIASNKYRVAQKKVDNQSVNIILHKLLINNGFILWNTDARDRIWR